jgi:hypothetical protein
MDFRYRKQAYCQLKYLNGGQQMYNRLSGRCSLFKEASYFLFSVNLLLVGVNYEQRTMQVCS